MNEIIKIEGLRKRFGDNEVLKGITTSVRKGEVVAIIGPSALLYDTEATSDESLQPI